MITAQSNEPTVPAMLHGRKNKQQGDASADDKRIMISLGNHLHIDSIDMSLALEGEMVRGIQCSVTLLGQDAQDAKVNTQLAIVIRFMDIDATIPGAIDLTDVEMTPLKRSMY